MNQGCIIVTGASRGIGAAIAHQLARAGFHIACLSRSGDLPQVEEHAEDVRKRWFALRCDVTSAEQVAAAIGQAATHFGEPIVGLVNNAGLHTDSLSIDLTPQDFNALMTMNALSVLTASQAVYAHLVEHGGLIVNIGSFFDKLGIKRNLAYCASKAAVGAITRCLAVEWASKGIRVMNVAPGYIVTDLNRDAMESGPLRAYLDKRIPAGLPGQASDVGHIVSGLFTSPSHFLTGETLYVDGGQGIYG